jgi:hypothetical protein
MLKKNGFNKSIRYVIQGLPMAGILITSLFPISTLWRQFLILIFLVWFQVYLIFDFFLHGY